MARVLVTGSAEGLGHGAAAALLDQGHQVVVHVRTPGRRPAVADLVGRGAAVAVGDLAHRHEVTSVADQVNTLGRCDAVIHNAGVGDGRTVLAVNVVAPYLLTALMDRPSRLVYLSSDMHAGGRARLDGIDWAQPQGSTYSDSKLFVTTLAAAVARRWPQVVSSAVDPGWVPTRMGGPSAPDDLVEGHVTQVWLATSDDPAALESGQFWHHRRVARPHRSVGDVQFQNGLLASLAEFTGVELGR
ncbi:SDR family NAD(P)-dependent oxidoreductase [Aestuariimicrobium soli]|uniref:SDR family NAD(P)-dependent oxidoreductase n=1 Tax=Aestuariimicrobium soli TaxID=2035834 RepID=UPI003EB9C03C